MTPNGAFVSIDEIVNAWLFKNGKTVHSYAKVLAFAAEAVREMSYTSMNLVQHKILVRDCQDWWDLPSDYSDYVSAGIRVGQFWRPIGVRTGLMPFPYTDGIAQYNPSEFSEVPGEMNTSGEWVNWLGPECDPADFWNTDFYLDDFTTQERVTPELPANNVTNIPTYNQYLPYQGFIPFFFSDLYNEWGQNKGRAFGFGDGNRIDSININVEKGIITCPWHFPGKELYLCYVGIGNVDSMSMLPKKAQVVVEAYISYKMAITKRNGIREGGAFKQLYDNELRLLRAKNDVLTTTDIKRAVGRAFGRTRE